MAHTELSDYSAFNCACLLFGLQPFCCDLRFHIVLVRLDGLGGSNLGLASILSHKWIDASACSPRAAPEGADASSIENKIFLSELAWGKGRAKFLSVLSIFLTQSCLSSPILVLLAQKMARPKAYVTYYIG